MHNSFYIRSSLVVNAQNRVDHTVSASIVIFSFSNLYRGKLNNKQHGFINNQKCYYF